MGCDWLPAACGVPTVGTRVGVLPEMEPEAARSCEPGNSQALAAAVGELLGDPGRLVAMGRTARAMAEEEYSLERCIERFRAIYAELA